MDHATDAQPTDATTLTKFAEGKAAVIDTREMSLPDEPMMKPRGGIGPVGSCDAKKCVVAYPPACDEYTTATPDELRVTNGWAPEAGVAIGATQSESVHPVMVTGPRRVAATRSACAASVEGARPIAARAASASAACTSATPVAETEYGIVTHA
jgi:hypothetical protein